MATLNKTFSIKNGLDVANTIVLDSSRNLSNIATVNATTVNSTTFITTQGLNVTDQANTARTQANTAYGQANAAYGQANTARDQANTARTQANDAYGQANTARAQANTAYGQANLAYAAANASGNTVAVYANSAGGLFNRNLNFVNTATVTVAVTGSGTNANIALTAVGTGGTGTGNPGSTRNEFTGTGACTTFTLTVTPTSEAHTLVFVDSVLQGNGDYNVSTNQIVFGVAPSNGANVEIYTIGDSGPQGPQGATGPQGPQGPSGATTTNEFIIDRFTGTGACTEFTLSQNTTTVKTFVYFNGVAQKAEVDYQVALNTLTFNTAPSNTVIVEARSISLLNIADISRVTSDRFTGTGACTTYTLTRSSNTDLAFVYIDGTSQVPTVDYQVAGTTLTFNVAPLNGTNIEARTFTSAAVGLAGRDGPQGPTGPSGPAGGPQGPTGATGPQGPQGPQGAQGSAGPQGPQGAAGPQGPQGIVGPQGPQGPEGPQGPQGIVGPQGPQGAQGNASTVPGPQGPQGATGNTGPQGPTGPSGPSGGPTGPSGPSGPSGPGGDAGPAYAQANAAYGQANAAYTAANNAVLRSGDTMTGTLTTTLKSYKEFLVTNTNVTTANTVDLSNSNWFRYTLTGGTTFTFANAPASGNTYMFAMLIIQDATGGRSVSWANTIYWAGGTIPPATTTANARDVWTFTTFDGGSTFIGTLTVKDAR
jgi:hypothetical protein